MGVFVYGEMGKWRNGVYEKKYTSLQGLYMTKTTRLWHSLNHATEVDEPRLFLARLVTGLRVSRSFVCMSCKAPYLSEPVNPPALE
jgi:hypothetical protein